MTTYKPINSQKEEYDKSHCDDTFKNIWHNVYVIIEIVYMVNVWKIVLGLKYRSSGDMYKYVHHVFFWLKHVLL